MTTLIFYIIDTTLPRHKGTEDTQGNQDEPQPDQSYSESAMASDLSHISRNNAGASKQN